MAKSMKTMSRICTIMRNLGTLTSYSMTKRFIRTSVHSTANYTKETLVSPRSNLICNDNLELSDSKAIQNTLQNCNTPTEIFRIVQTNRKNMSANDVICALNALIKIDQSKSDKNKFENLYKHEEFLILCEILKANIRSVDPNDCLTALKSMLYFNVPSTSIIVQTILQMLRHNINQLELQRLSFLEFLLSKCEKTPLVQALKIAVPIVYENNVLAKYDRENINSIQNALTFMCKSSRNSEMLNVLLHSIKTCKQEIDPLCAKNILWNLCEIKCYPDHLPSVLNYVQDILAENITFLDRSSVTLLLQRITMKIRQGEKYYYHEGFFDACSSKVISEDWGFKDALNILDIFMTISHTQIALLDYIAGKCYEDLTLLKSCPAEDIAILVQGFSYADYKPIFWDVLEEAIKSDRIIDNIKNYPLSKLSCNLLSLDCFCPKILKKAFETYDEKIARGFEKGRMLLVYQAVKTLYPQYSGPFPTTIISNYYQHPRKLCDHTFTDALHSAFGGPSYVLTNIRSALGHIIDHAIVMDKKGFPVAINHEFDRETGDYPVQQLEDIKPPKDSQVILIVCISEYGYSVNTQRMKGSWALQIRSLEALSGYTVIPIRLWMWSQLPESNKIPYLIKAIKLKCEEVSASVNL